MPTRESLAFDERGEALAPAPRGRSRSCCSVAETDRVAVVVVIEVGATAPGGNSSAESVAASSSPEAATPANEPFVIAFEFAVGSDLTWCKHGQHKESGQSTRFSPVGVAHVHSGTLVACAGAALSLLQMQGG